MRLLKLTILYNSSIMENMESNIDETIQNVQNEEHIIEQLEQVQLQEQPDVVQSENVIESLIKFIESEYINIMVQMVNEFDLVFDYIDKSEIKKLKKYIKTLVKSDILDKQMREYMDYMSKYEKNMQNVIGNTKTKTQDLVFLNDIILFEGFNFNVFKDENKSTKRTIIQYLYNMYMSCQFIITYNANKTNSIQELDISDALKNFTEMMSLKFTKEQQSQPEDSSQQASSSKRTTNKSNGNPLEQLGDIGNVFNDILANKDIMNLATDISKDLQNQKIDPMMIMSGLLTGKPSPMLNNLVNKITTKLENKMQSGEIDKRVFEEQAKNVLNAVNKTDLNKVLNKINKKH